MHVIQISGRNKLFISISQFHSQLIGEEEKYRASQEQDNLLQQIRMMKLDKLNDDVTRIIMQFCDVTSMLRLAETSKRFNQLMGATSELMERFTLKIDFTKVLNGKQSDHTLLADVKAIHKVIMNNERKYRKLSFVDPFVHNYKNQNKFKPYDDDILELLGKTITVLHLNIYQAICVDKLVQIISAMQNVKKFSLSCFSADLIKNIEKFDNQNFNCMPKLKDLEISNYYVSILKLFQGLANLNSFNFQFVRFPQEQQQQLLVNFMRQQTQLKHLTFSNGGLSCWSTFEFKLKSLKLQQLHLHGMPEFLAQQHQIESMDIYIVEDSIQKFHDIIKAIFGLPKLRKLKISQNVCGLTRELSRLPQWFFDDLHNNTIKEFELTAMKNFIQVTNKLEALEKIAVIRESNCDISELRLDLIDKVSFSKGFKPFYGGFIYSPNRCPRRESFERVFTKKLCDESSKWQYATFLRIGHPQWLQHRSEFQLTFEFCKMLVDKLRDLRVLVLYNVHDCYEELQAYLTEHKPESLQKIILNKETLVDREELGNYA